MDWVWRKFDSLGNAYSDISSLVIYGTADLDGDSVGDVTTTSFTVTDGDPATDEDGIADGFINDPSGPATVIASSSGSGSRGGSVRHTCEDPTALNYDDSGFGRHKKSLCKYPQPVTTPVTDTLGAGQQCSPSQLLTQNMRAGARNGQFHSYTGETVREVKILQAHMNRLGFNSGPVDGILGPITDGAIKRMQKFLGTFQDGYVGPITQSLINNSCGEEVPVVTKPVLDIAQCPFFTEYYKQGDTGPEITKIQTFLQNEGLLTATPNGNYGPATAAAINAFQSKYASDVLAPWNLTKPTGRWYQSTRKKANEVAGCSEGTITLDNGVSI